MSPSDPTAAEHRVLVLAPTGKDATNSLAVLSRAGLDGCACRDVAELCREIGAGAAVVILTEEALALDRAGLLVETLREQPAWSDLPVVVLTRGGPESPAAMRAMNALGNVILLERPVRLFTLVTAAKTAIRARAKQYQVRAQMHELLQADSRKDEFIAMLAHELRNPLAPLRNGLQALHLSDAPDIRAQAQDMMDRQLSHMVRLIDDLLDVSRINRAKMELRREVVALNDVVTSAVESAQPAVEAAGHDLSVSLPSIPVFLDADLTRLAQVFSNLLTNSAKYTPPGGRIWLTADRQGDDVVIAVRDTGLGIPAASLSDIFNMFSQVDRTTEKNTGGLGIGLALVKGLVEMHGGTVTAESPGPNQGSTFTVRLPTVEQAAPTRPAEVVNRTPGVHRRVLVVDDNRDGAGSMALMLKLLGEEVHTAYDGIEAVEQAEQFGPEVILMDIGMPRLNGLEATRRIRAQNWGRRVKIIALTGWGQESDREQSRAAGCDGHLVKPVKLTDLQKLLGEFEEN